MASAPRLIFEVGLLKAVASTGSPGRVLIVSSFCLLSVPFSFTSGARYKRSPSMPYTVASPTLK